MAKIRRSLLILWIRSSIPLWVLILLIALIYLGGVANPNHYTRNLDVLIVDSDQQLVGQYFTRAFQQSNLGNQTLHWIYGQSMSIEQVIQEVLRGKVWAAVYLSAGVTEQVNYVIHSILNAKSSIVNPITYDPVNTVTIVYEEGRNAATYNGWILPPIRTVLQTLSNQISAYIQSDIAQSSNTFNLYTQLSLIQLADITTSPIQYTLMNIHPASPYVSQLGTTLGYLFLWLLMVTLVGANVKITRPMAGKIKIIHIVIFRTLNIILNSLVISLIYSLCVLWFARIHSHIQFVRLWLFNWLCAATFSIIIGLFTINLGALAQFFLTVFLITNLSASTNTIAIELQPRFYRVGYGLPLYHAVNGGRHLLVGSHSHFGVDIATLFAYYFACLFFTLLSGIYRMRKQEQEVKKKALEKILSSKSKRNKKFFT
ncbi:unnamed protein product [Didymodactylos carnosus]|uniref:DUF3533 domain-containing protein n=1 Tax=Didymodactylos carnosus TaxID=1234261 RepID=A0A814S3P4_9BILA|nr:unnamed protein product [Didymodactylos carnosus]CAF1142737.1 unnamed protein product [Didymodactylos carnosus]CAF3651095.1 unnamed protein product [Didymodactylos carnosus]CAF3906375.1 unnamed protein product [Didymodactylos carnosus]